MATGATPAPAPATVGAAGWTAATPASTAAGCRPMGTVRSGEHTSGLQSHRDLHSFPTRRSSDLHKVRYPRTHEVPRTSFLGHRLGARRCMRRRGAWPRARLRHRLRRRWGRRDGRQPLPRRRPRAADRWARSDPESTRLDFSHTEIYTLSLHDALPISTRYAILGPMKFRGRVFWVIGLALVGACGGEVHGHGRDSGTGSGDGGGGGMDGSHSGVDGGGLPTDGHV